MISDEKTMKECIEKSSNQERTRHILNMITMIINDPLKEYREIITEFKVSLIANQKIMNLDDELYKRIEKMMITQLIINVIGNSMQIFKLIKEDIVKMLETIEKQNKNIEEQEK